MISAMTQKPVSFTCDTTVQPQYSIAENKNYPVYYDPFDTISDNKIYDKWKPGLQIYYPYEIELRYNYAAASSKYNPYYPGTAFFNIS
ncbi:hypothetical protein [Treponema phagedenis]|uniref:hypothetical protein n=1 Tax=Treponema phagedenis TaxID=162 RepID=UPI001CA431A9|nr:hypothetical protein [Treponema phagedenis]